jgi:hypothetical protein
MMPAGTKCPDLPCPLPTPVARCLPVAILQAEEARKPSSAAS